MRPQRTDGLEGWASSVSVSNVWAALVSGLSRLIKKARGIDCRPPAGGCSAPDPSGLIWGGLSRVGRSP